MKLRQLTSEIAQFELREQVGELLSESISDYFSLTLAMLKNNKPVDLDQLALFISGLKVLGDSDLRQSMTRDDIGINPNNSKDLFNTLNSITKDGKNLDKQTAEVFVALKLAAPSLYKKTLVELGVFEKGTKTEKDQEIKKIQLFSTKVNQLFYKLKHGVAQPKNTVKSSTEEAFDSIGNFPSP